MGKKPDQGISVSEGPKPIPQALVVSQESESTSPKVKTYPAHVNIAPKAIAIYCVDPRFLTAIEQFIEEELNLSRSEYVPFALGGGVASLAEPFMFPKDAKYVREQLQFYADHFASIDRVVLINHEDCGKYAAMTKAAPIMLSLVRNIVERQQKDLAKVSNFILGFLPRKFSVEQYYAKFTDSKRTEIIFEKV